MAPSLPPFAPFPPAVLRAELAPTEWAACLDAWVTLAEAHLSLSDADFAYTSLRDESLARFLSTFTREIGTSGAGILGGSSTASTLLKACSMLTARCSRSASPSSIFLQWEFLSHFAQAYGKKRAGSILATAAESTREAIDNSLAGLKKFLIKNLDDGVNGDLKTVQECLDPLCFLVHASPSAASFFLAGSDFLDGLVNCFKVMNPPLRMAIVTITYLCLLGLTEGKSPKYAMLSDQLYSLKTAAAAHKKGPLNANDSLVAELVTSTPLLQQVQYRLEAADSLTPRVKLVLQDLGAYRKPGGGMKPKHLIRRKIDKGKSVATAGDEGLDQSVHIHRMSQITQVQDLFPELGSGFVSKLLQEYGEDAEQVIAHLLDGTLGPHLEDADRTEELPPIASLDHPSLVAVPHATPPLLPTRRNVFDDDELDRLVVDTSRLHFGKRGPGKTADDVLNDRSTAPNKAAILSALAAFDSDDDERDDTYDVEDVGGTVENSLGGEDVQDTNEDVLFRAYQVNAKVFERDAVTRRSEARLRLKEETGMTDEAIEGWALMLSRNPQQKRRLEARLSMFAAAQPELAPTAWRASPAGSGTEDSGTDGASSFRGGRGRGRAWGLGNRGRGNVAGPAGDKDTEQARRRKEASKGSRGNHNRRNERARKIARGGFPG